MIRRSALIALSLCFCATEVVAESNSCLDKATTTDDVMNCGNVLVPPIEDKINKEFTRIGDKYQNNDEMKTMLRLTKESWNNYRNIQCNLEGAAASDGQTKGVLPVKGQKTFQACVVRTLQQMESALSKL
jgi:uncharacterized protein YecT (DUF1311 family)